ncbi:hypothetical protein E2C01_029413 [Portunus trituberculatus]|uniref:Uncharacterized protein n=1 Tax=Portunus trituberculatus TaxID=210409 RepID=A0A5B7ESU8_PORTR|nr:hypothetical protein [Portunus trituberculatus]
MGDRGQPLQDTQDTCLHVLPHRGASPSAKSQKGYGDGDGGDADDDDSEDCLSHWQTVRLSPSQFGKAGAACVKRLPQPQRPSSPPAREQDTCTLHRTCRPAGSAMEY